MTAPVKTIARILASVIGIELVIYGAFFVESMSRVPTISHFKTLLFEWQTQIGGLTAILAALIGAGAVFYQTKQNEISASAEKDARKNIAELLVIHDLSQLMRYLGQCVEYMSMLLSNFEHDEIMYRGRLPRLEGEQIKSMCQSTHGLRGLELAAMSDIVKCLQILTARLEFFEALIASRKLTEMAIESRIIDLLYTYIRSSQLLGYIRDRQGALEGAVDTSLLSSAVFSILHAMNDYDDLRRRVLNRFETYTPFMRFSSVGVG